MISRDEYLKYSKDNNNEIISKILETLGSDNLNRSIRSKLNQMLNDISNANPSDTKEGFECDSKIKGKINEINLLVKSDKITSAGQLTDELIDSAEYKRRLTSLNPQYSLPLTKAEIKALRKKEKAEKKLTKKQIEEKTIELLVSEAVDEQKRLIKAIHELTEDIEEAQNNEDIAMVNYLKSRISKTNMLLQAATNVSQLRDSAENQQLMIKIAQDFMAEKSRMDKRKNSMLSKEDFSILMQKYAQAMEETRSEDPTLQAGMSTLFGGQQMQTPQMGMAQMPNYGITQTPNYGMAQMPNYTQQQPAYTPMGQTPQVNNGPISTKKLEKALEDVEERITEINSQINRLGNQKQLIGDKLKELLEQRKTITPSQALVLDSKINELKSKYTLCDKAIQRKVSEKNELIARKNIAEEHLGQTEDLKDGLKINTVLINDNIASMAENINQNIVDRNNNIAELDVAASIANSEKYNTVVNTANGFETDSIGAEFDAHAFDDLKKELGVEPLSMEENETN